MNSSYLSMLLSSNFSPAAASMMRDGVQRQPSQLSAVASLRNDENAALFKHLAQQQEIQQMARLNEQVDSFRGRTCTNAPVSLANHDSFSLALLEQELQHKQRLQDLRSSCLGQNGFQNGINPFLSTVTPRLSNAQSLAQMAAANTMNIMIGLKTKNDLERLQHMARESILQQQQTSSVAVTQLVQQTIQDAMNLAIPLPAARKRKGRTGTFPQKLHQILDDLEKQGRCDIASFMPNGRAFAIHKPIEFAEEIAPKYFRMSHFSSLQRQLNLYDFQRITEGPEKGGYYVSTLHR
jgi:hypothetical protein